MSSPPPIPPVLGGAVAVHMRRCVRHGQREAAARCPACAGFFCRECVVDHGGRVLCANCLTRETAKAPERKKVGQAAMRGLGLALAVWVLWMMFYAGGLLLLRLPEETHAAREGNRGAPVQVR